MATNPLIPDRDVAFLLREVLDLPRLLRLPAFEAHTVETIELYLASARRFAREVLFPSYKSMDEEPSYLEEGGTVRAHPLMHVLYPSLVELGLITATRPIEAGGQGLPQAVHTLASAYLMAGNLSATGYLGLTAGAARLIESFGSDTLKERFLPKMQSGQWTGTMALTEPQAGSSLNDVKTRATPVGHHFLIEGSKVFISGGDHDLVPNIVHLTLARIDGAPMGLKGVSLFAIPKRREDGPYLADNDVVTAGVFKKVGWRGIPSVALNFGERGDCRGWLVGEPNQGIKHMFQMMNEARIMVGTNAVATASVAYQQALLYAKERPQGRPFSARDPATPQVPIIEHADVRRMLLRQKAIVEGGLGLLALTASYADVAEHEVDAETRRRGRLLLDLLTPIAKSFPAEFGQEANSLAIQVHGGYGYTSEFLPEAWWRDQRLNAIHEGTTGIQGFDLLGRKVVAEEGAAFLFLSEEIGRAMASARDVGVDPALGDLLGKALEEVGRVTVHLGGLGLQGEVEAMMAHANDYLTALSIVVIGWSWLLQATAAQRGLSERPHDAEFYRGKLQAARYWIKTEVPKVGHLMRLAEEVEASYLEVRPEWL